MKREKAEGNANCSIFDRPSGAGQSRLNPHAGQWPLSSGGDLQLVLAQPAECGSQAPGATTPRGGTATHHAGPGGSSPSSSRSRGRRTGTHEVPELWWYVTAASGLRGEGEWGMLDWDELAFVSEVFSAVFTLWAFFFWRQTADIYLAGLEF